MSAPINYTENELLELLRNGSEEAFNIIYRRHSERLYFNLLKLVKSPEVAEELLQDIFTKIWVKRANVDIRVGFYPYLYQIGRNLMLDFFKKAAKNKELLNQLAKGMGQIDADGLEDDFSEKKEILDKALEQLPLQRRQVFYLCKIEGKSYQEVSNMLRISASTISDHIVKATKSIRTFVNDYNSDAIIALAVFILLKDL